MSDPVTSKSALHGSAVLRLQAQVLASGFRAQAIPARYTKASIHHLVIQLFILKDGQEEVVRDGAGSPVAADLLNSELDDQIAFNSLDYDTPYRVRCFAYKAPGTSAQDLISSSDSAADITLSRNAEPTLVALKVRLIDVIFGATATVSEVDVQDGGVIMNGPVIIYNSKSAVTTLAGTTRGYIDGPAEFARFDTPYGLAMDASGSVYVSDDGNQLIRTVDASGSVSTFGPFSATGGTNPGASISPFGYSFGISLAADGSLFLANTSFSNVSRISSPPASVSVFAGTGTSGLLDGMATESLFNQPVGIAMSPSGTLFVSDTLNNCIRLVLSDGFTFTMAGGSGLGDADGYASAARFNHPTGIALDNQGNLFIADTDNHKIRKIDRYGYVTTVAGTGEFGDNDGPAAQARFDGPTGLAVDSDGTLYVADTNNNCIRKITPQGYVTTLAGSGVEGLAEGPSFAAKFSHPSGLLLDGQGNLLVADTGNHRIRKIRLK